MVDSSDIEEFLAELELLPYFIKVDSIEYRSLKFADAEERNSENIEIMISLFIKKK